MKAFTVHNGIVAPLDASNVDTDQIIPKQYLKSIERTGFGPNLFDDMRYLDPGYPGMDHSKRRLNPDFVLNQPRYKDASILITRDNFGCGSSREHAPWAIDGAGFRAVIAPSFADIFYNNSFKNGLMLITLEDSEVDELFEHCAAEEGYSIEIDLEQQVVTTAHGEYHFEINEQLKNRMLNGLDDIGVTLQYADDIAAYEARRSQDFPWLS